MDANKTINNQIPKPLFLLFAEFLGYDSPLVEIAEKICSGDSKEKFYINLINCNADNIFRKMCEDYTIEEIQNYYDTFFTIALEKHFNNLKRLLDDDNSDLPF